LELFHNNLPLGMGMIYYSCNTPAAFSVCHVAKTMLFACWS